MNAQLRNALAVYETERLLDRLTYGHVTADENAAVCNELRNRFRALAAPEEAGPVWTYCPECGSEKLHHAEGAHKQCAQCHQEWFSDHDYSEVVRSNLARLANPPGDQRQEGAIPNTMTLAEMRERRTPEQQAAVDAARPRVREYIADLKPASPPPEAAAAVGDGLREALSSIYQYGADTLSGRADGPDDRKWQRDAVLEMTRRAEAALAAPYPVR